MIAEDDTGASYIYGDEGFPEEMPRPNAADWLKVKPKPGEINEYTISRKSRR